MAEADTEELSKLGNALDFDGDGDHDNIDDDENDLQVEGDSQQESMKEREPPVKVRSRRKTSSEDHDDSESLDAETGDEDDDDIIYAEKLPSATTEEEDYEAELLASIGKHRPGSGYDSESIPAPDTGVDDEDDHDDDDEVDGDDGGSSRTDTRTEPGQNDGVDDDDANDDDDDDDEEDNFPGDNPTKDIAQNQPHKRKKVVVKEDPDDFRPDPNAPLKFKRTHGTLPKPKQRPIMEQDGDDDDDDDDDDHDDDDDDEVHDRNNSPSGSPLSFGERIRKLKELLLRRESEEDDGDAPDPSKPVRYVRKKGTQSQRTSRTADDDDDEDDDDDQAVLPASGKAPGAPSKSSMTAKGLAPLRYYRTKGSLPSKPKMSISEPSQSLEKQYPIPPTPKPKANPKADQETSKPEVPMGPIRYFRTKGSLPPPPPRRHTSQPPSDSTASLQGDRTSKSTEIDKVDREIDKPPLRYYRRKGKPQRTCTKDSCSEHVSGLDVVDTAAQDRSDAPKRARRVGVTTLTPVQSSYRKARITNRDDNKIRNFLDEADRLLEQNKLDDAYNKFIDLTDRYKRSPRAQFGLAKTIERLADKRQSNALLESSILSYEKVLSQPYVPDDLYLLAVERLVDRARFRGWMEKAVEAQAQLVDRFPDRLDLRNGHGVTFLMMGRNEDAKRVFADVLRKDPDNGFAQAHYGFIVKTVDNNLDEAAAFLMAGIASAQDGTQDGRFFFHLGDALQRLGRREEAYKIYQLAAAKGIFLSAVQRSLHNVEHLTGKPWWSVRETGYQDSIRELERNWKAIKEEGVALLKKRPKSFLDEDEKLTEEGVWKQFTLYRRGRKVPRNCEHAPHTCDLVEEFEEAVSCTRGQIKFSLMEGGTKVFPHCGPTNCRLRGHLGLVVPPEARIRVTNETRSWTAGKFIIFDDSFEHEVWHNGKDLRLILIVDFWHPELTSTERTRLEPI